ncbi:hypothetical protein [Ferrovibrio sp.]|uniref:hypothetical protein n=1 Tax=Ferrovibrio sp. TaxID=1917215 RepID=UPI0025BDA9DB|nr:hypothetical protein [Ferrovibrio sp.]MBX3455697.1 hypothetical protein [Ferrovibrio sp.]
MTYLTALGRRTWRLFLDLIKIMLPVMLAVKLAEDFGLVAWLAGAIAPAFGITGLPPEAALVWVSTALVGIYGGLGALLGLGLGLEGHISLSQGQLAALAAMMLFAHGLPMEQAIVRRAGASFWFTALLRAATALLYGSLVAHVSAATGWLAEPADLSRLAAHNSDAGAGSGEIGWGEWLLGAAESFALIGLIILGLLMLLDAMDRLGITRRFTQALGPLLRWSGLDDKLAPVTTLGVLLGLTYGGGLIIEQARNGDFTPRQLVPALCWLSLSHALIEDTLLLWLLGADIWVILVGRVILTLAIVAGLVWLLHRLPDRTVERWFAA